MSQFVYVRIPKKFEGSFSNLNIEHLNLLSHLIDWLGKSSENDFHYSLIKNLVSSFPPAGLISSDNFPEILKPYASIDGYMLNRFFVQHHIVSQFEFIYSPISLVGFLSGLNCLNFKGLPVNYFTVKNWKINYYDRALKISKLRSRDCRAVSEKKQEYDLMAEQFLKSSENISKLKSDLSIHCSYNEIFDFSPIKFY